MSSQPNWIRIRSLKIYADLFNWNDYLDMIDMEPVNPLTTRSGYQEFRAVVMRSRFEMLQEIFGAELIKRKRIQHMTEGGEIRSKWRRASANT